MNLELGDGGFEGEAVHQMHDAHLFGGGHEIARAENGAVGFDEAQQGFVMRDFARLGVDDGLIGELEALLLERLHHLVGDGHLAQPRRLALGRRLIDGKAVAAPLARALQGLLGAQHRRLAGGGGGGQPDRADRGGGRNLAAAGFDGAAAHRSLEPRRHDGDFTLGAIFEDDAEFVAGDAADDVARTQGAGKALAHRHDHFVARIEAETVIDHREAVDGSDEEGAMAAFRLGAVDRHRQFRAQRIAVEMAGKFVAGGEIGEPLHLAGAFGVFAHDPDQALGAPVAARHAGTDKAETDRPHGGSDFDIERESLRLVRVRIEQGLERRALVALDAVEEDLRAGSVAMRRQDVGGAVPQDDAFGDMPVEHGDACGLNREPETRGVFREPQARQVRHAPFEALPSTHPPSPGRFSGRVASVCEEAA